MIHTQKFCAYFYPRSPCGERRKPNKLAGLKLVFLSTLSLRRATVGAVLELQCVLDFYPRSPCGERHTSIAGRITSNDFYPRSPCGERRYIGSNVPNFTHFYPRSPCGERLTSEVSERVPLAISIHALLAESDVSIIELIE